MPAYIRHMRKALLVAACLLAVLNTAAESMDQQTLVYLLKPMATLALVAIVLTTRRAARYRTWIAAGLSAGLAGDILLMLPQSQMFVPGLVAFLLGHLCYIAAFSTDGGGWKTPLIPAIPVAAAALVVLSYLWPSLGPMRVPVAAYVSVISAMSWQAIARWSVRRTPGALLAALGSIAFMMSDSSLAINRFVAPFVGASLVIHATYYAAQWGLALSVKDDSRSPAS